ncbi:Rpn family recombination-promoting nuclease/putative transposase [Phormidesmis sp. 146-12]
MRRDSIFYKLFAQAPDLLFDLLDHPPPNAQNYRFDSVAVKEPTFEIDGVFLPPDTDPPGIVFFCEVQFQRDETLYERLFGESFLYFYRNRSRFCDWQAVVIYPTRQTEQTHTHPYRALLQSQQVDRIFLDELGEIQTLPLGVALMVLTTVDEPQAPQAARELLARSQQANLDPQQSRVIMDMIATILVYKFTDSSRQEIETMLGLNLQQTRVYQEAKAEGRQEGREEGRQEGRQEEASALILRQLERQVGAMNLELQAQVRSLPLPQLEALSEALLDFGTIADLTTWLENDLG